METGFVTQKQLCGAIRNEVSSSLKGVRYLIPHTLSSRHGSRREWKHFLPYDKICYKICYDLFRLTLIIYKQKK